MIVLCKKATTTTDITLVPMADAAASHSGTRLGRLAGRLTVAPAFLADEKNHSALCATKPPFGLASDRGQLEAALRVGLNVSKNASAALNAGRSLQQICLHLAAVLERRTVGWSSKRGVAALYRSCAVVGSGGGLQGSGHGARIDRADAVFRFNNAPVAGFGADVGNRTTFMVGSHKPWITGVSRSGNRNEKPTPSSPGPHQVLYCFNAWLGSCFHAALHLGITRYPLMVNPLLVGRMQDEQRLSGATGRYVRPTTGLMGIGLALSLCSQTTLFGFGNATDPSEAASCLHYWVPPEACGWNQSRAEGNLMTGWNQSRYFSGRMGNHDWHAQWRVLSKSRT